MQTPGLNHVILTISNTEQSRAFYGDLLGFPSRQPTPNDRISEFRIGLDHLSFTAPSIETLQELADKLIAAGVDTKGVEQFVHTGNYYVAFRDPDNIQLEYWLS